MLLKYFFLLYIFFSSTYFFYGCGEEKVNILNKFTKHNLIKEIYIDYYKFACGYVKEGDSYKCVSIIIHLADKFYEIFFSNNDLQNIEIFIEENDTLSNNIQYFNKIREKQCLIFNQFSQIDDEKVKKSFEHFEIIDLIYSNEDILKEYKPKTNLSDFTNVPDQQMKQNETK